MALTLNGSANTIAGLAVGGLPDGIVDEDMLAANAVATAKIAAEAVTAPKLEDRKIINISNITKDNGSDNYINNTTGDIGAETSIVRKSASSNFLIYIATVIHRPSGGGWGTLGYTRKIGSGSYSATQQMTKVRDATANGTETRFYVDTTTGSAGDTVYIRPRYGNDIAQNDNPRECQCIIMEFEP